MNGFALGPLAFRWGTATDPGKVRQENEDTFLVEPEAGLFLVSDGMGGHRGGALASKIVAEDLSVLIETKLNKLRSHSVRAVRSMLKKCLVQQNRHLQMEGTSEDGYKDMGATVVLALLKDGRAYIANLGDSRMYLLRNARLSQQTMDHSVVSALLRQGTIEPHEVENHAAQGEITRYVGMVEEARPHVRTFLLKKNDRLLLCTDGLTDMLPDSDIGSILTSQDAPQLLCHRLIQAANQAGGHDNITVVVIDWLG